MKQRLFLYTMILIGVIIFAACGGAPAEAPANAAAPTEAAAEPAAPAQPEGCLGSADTALVNLECREIKIAVENAYLPFNYISLETGEPGGWDYDVFAEICTRLHCTPVYVETAWDGLIQSVADGQSDVGGDGITITEERKEIVDFSIGYIKISQRLLVRKGETRFDGIEALAKDESLVLGTQTGTTNYETATKYLPEARIKAFEQFPFAVQALIAGDVDAVIMDEVVGMGYMGENADTVELIGESISSDELGFVYPKGSDLVEPFDKALQSMMEDGTLAEINVKYFGPDFKITYDDIKTE